jgi:hypothetical protein
LRAIPTPTTVHGHEGDDRLLVASMTKPTTIDGGEGSDRFWVGSTEKWDLATLDVIMAPLTIVGSGHPDGGKDSLYVNDRRTSGQAGYLVTPTSITYQPGSPVTSRFASIEYDDTLEAVRLDVTDQANVIEVQPSLSTEFFIDGNLPAPGSVVPGQGDYLKLDTQTTGTAGHQLDITAPGSGSWTFTSGHQPVGFESIERFNHVEIVAVGADAGATSKPRVLVYDAETMELKFSFLAYARSYQGGVRVATGDVNLDGIPDVITAPGRNHPPVIKVFNGAPQPGQTGRVLQTLNLPAANTYGNNFKQGLSVAVGDVTGDGAPDIAAVPTRGKAIVKVFRNEFSQGGAWARIRSFNAFAQFPKFIGGATLAIADLDGKQDGNGRSDILVASGPGMRARVRGFDVTQPASSYAPFVQIVHPNRGFRSGWSVTAGDINGDQLPDIITGAGPLGKSLVYTYNGGPRPQLLRSFRAFPELAGQPQCGIRVLARDIDDDGRAELLVAQCPDSQSNYEIRRFEPLTGKLVDSFFATHPDFSGGGLFLG